MKKFIAIVFVVIVLSSPGCRRKDAGVPVVDARAAAVWSNNERAFVKALKWPLGR